MQVDVSESGHPPKHSVVTINEKDASEYDVSESDQHHSGTLESDHTLTREVATQTQRVTSVQVSTLSR